MMVWLRRQVDPFELSHIYPTAQEDANIPYIFQIPATLSVRQVLSNNSKLVPINSMMPYDALQHQRVTVASGKPNSGSFTATYAPDEPRSVSSSSSSSEIVLGASDEKDIGGRPRRRRTESAFEASLVSTPRRWRLIRVRSQWNPDLVDTLRTMRAISLTLHSDTQNPPLSRADAQQSVPADAVLGMHLREIDPLSAVAVYPDQFVLYKLETTQYGQFVTAGWAVVFNGAPDEARRMTDYSPPAERSEITALLVIYGTGNSTTLDKLYRALIETLNPTRIWRFAPSDYAVMLDSDWQPTALPYFYVMNVDEMQQ